MSHISSETFLILHNIGEHLNCGIVEQLLGKARKTVSLLMAQRESFPEIWTEGYFGSRLEKTRIRKGDHNNLGNVVS